MCWGLMSIFLLNDEVEILSNLERSNLLRVEHWRKRAKASVPY